MKLIINIPKDVYIRLFDNGIQDNEIAVDDVCEMARALRLGTPLPEGHGRLVDISEVLIKLMQYYDGDKTIGQCLDEVNTIIEADGGDAE